MYCSIIYRDLKPENIGFDIRGDCKLFDFGLARELRPNLKNTDGLYALTGLTGSRRYMAPEVVLCKVRYQQYQKKIIIQLCTSIYTHINFSFYQ